jgi:DNA-binding NtrC family response regulator
VAAIERLLERAAEAERRPTPQLSDAALGSLWRCDWPRGLRQLAELLRRLVLLAPPQPVDGSVVEALLRRAGLRCPRKLPSRHPEPELLLNALEATGLDNGRRNKTRAARLLGWDVDTLEARLADRGLA